MCQSLMNKNEGSILTRASLVDIYDVIWGDETTISEAVEAKQSESETDKEEA